MLQNAKPSLDVALLCWQRPQKIWKEKRRNDINNHEIKEEISILNSSSASVVGIRDRIKRKIISSADMEKTEAFYVLCCEN